MISKFFNLKVIDPSGNTHKASWKERFIWLFRGCPLRNEKVIQRYQKMLKNH